MTQPEATTSHALAPTDALLNWLDRNGGARDIGGPPKLKLPVDVTLDPDRLGIAGATLGGFPVNLDDSALGIALADRVRQKCAAPAITCRVWVEGTWHGQAGDVGQVHVSRFVGLVAATDAGDRVEIMP